MPKGVPRKIKPLESKHDGSYIRKIPNIYQNIANIYIFCTTPPWIKKWGWWKKMMLVGEDDAGWRRGCWWTKMMLLVEEDHDCGYFGDCFAIVWGLFSERSEAKQYPSEYSRTLFCYPGGCSTWPKSIRMNLNLMTFYRTGIKMDENCTPKPFLMVKTGPKWTKIHLKLAILNQNFT